MSNTIMAEEVKPEEKVAFANRKYTNEEKRKKEEEELIKQLRPKDFNKKKCCSFKCICSFTNLNS